MYAQGPFSTVLISRCVLYAVVAGRWASSPICPPAFSQAYFSFLFLSNNNWMFPFEIFLDILINETLLIMCRFSHRRRQSSVPFEKNGNGNRPWWWYAWLRGERVLVEASFLILSFEHYEKTWRQLNYKKNNSDPHFYFYMGFWLFHLLSVGCLYYMFFFSNPLVRLRRSRWKLGLTEGGGSCCLQGFAGGRIGEVAIKLLQLIFVIHHH